LEFALERDAFGYTRLMIEHGRHVPLRPIHWSESDATAAIEDIVADGLEHFYAECLGEAVTHCGPAMLASPSICGTA